MNTIGSEKLTMSLDDIIASEPLRYATAVTRPTAESQSPTKSHRPRIYGRLRHEPYKQGLQQQRQNRQTQQNWNGRGRFANKGVAPKPKPSPYDFNSFTWNGVHVAENSAMLNRTVGQVEIICRDEYDIKEEEDEDDEEDEEVPNNQAAPTIGVHLGNPLAAPSLVDGISAQPRLYTDLNYVRKPVHQRLGWSANDQFRKSRVDFAAKFLRKQKRLQQNKIIRLPDGSFKAVHQEFISKKEMRNRRKFLKAQAIAGNSDAMQVSFVNELALPRQPQKPRPLLELQTSLPRPMMHHRPLMQGNGAGDDVFIAPLSRQNVARLPGAGRFNDSGASSRISTMTNEEQIAERLSTLERAMTVLSSTQSMVNGFLPPMSSTAAMMGHQGAVMLPVVGGGMQAYVPLVGGGGGAASGCLLPGQPRYAAFQSHIVEPQEGGGLVVKSIGNVRNVETNGRLRRQLLAAADRQPLTQTIQASISAAQAGFRCNNHDRPSREVFAYRPKPHVTRCSTNDRIKHYPKPANRGRRAKHNN